LGIFIKDATCENQDSEKTTNQVGHMKRYEQSLEFCMDHIRYKFLHAIANTRQWHRCYVGKIYQGVE
jgi:hypothetical protein